jgi:hypothetical protein
MPIYPIVNIKTGEEDELEISIAEWVKWSEENKDEWKRDWSKGCASPGEAAEWRDQLIKKHPAWNEILDKSSRAPGSTVKKL